MTEQEKAVVTADAKNRAWRTFLQNAAWDVVAAVVLLLFPLISNATGWQDVDWKVMGFMVAKTALASFLAYCMRYFKSLNGVAPPPTEAGRIDLQVIFYVLGIIFFFVGTLWLLGAETRLLFG